MTIEDRKEKIEKLRKGILSPATPNRFKEAMKQKVIDLNAMNDDEEKFDKSKNNESGNMDYKYILNFNLPINTDLEIQNFERLKSFLLSRIKIDNKFQDLGSISKNDEFINCSINSIVLGFLAKPFSSYDGFDFIDEDLLFSKLENCDTIVLCSLLSEFLDKKEWNFKTVKILEGGSINFSSKNYFFFQIDGKYGDLKYNEGVRIIAQKIFEYFNESVHSVIKQAVIKTISLRDWMTYFNIIENQVSDTHNKLSSKIYYKDLSDSDLIKYDDDDDLNFLKQKLSRLKT